MPENVIGVKDFFQLLDVFFQKDDFPFTFFEGFRQVVYEPKSFCIFALEFFEGKITHLKHLPFGFDVEFQEVPVLTRRRLGRLYAVLLKAVFSCLLVNQQGQME